MTDRRSDGTIAYEKGPRPGADRAPRESTLALRERIRAAGIELAEGDVYPTLPEVLNHDETLTEGSVKKHSDALNEGRDIWEARHGEHPYRRREVELSNDPVGDCRFEYFFLMQHLGSQSRRIETLEAQLARALEERDAAIVYARNTRARNKELSSVLGSRGVQALMDN